MGTRLTIKPRADYLLKRDVCSYGYFSLAPNRWDPHQRTLTRVLDPGDGPTTIIVSQREDQRGATLSVTAGRALARAEQRTARAQIARMLRHDEDLTEFHAIDPRWRKSGRGRIFRSPSIFEDIVKTITSCNVTWPGTRRMNHRMCEVINPAFPKPQQMARRKPQTLRSRCGVGYRDVRLVELARMFVRGDIDEAWFEDESRSDDEIHKALLALPGCGKYAAANMMQLLGRYSMLPIDTEAIRHGKESLGMTGTTASIEKQVRAHYEQFGRHRFRSYWLELWTEHEAKEGPAWEWERRE